MRDALPSPHLRTRPPWPRSQRWLLGVFASLFVLHLAAATLYVFGG